MRMNHKTANCPNKFKNDVRAIDKSFEDNLACANEVGNTALNGFGGGKVQCNGQINAVMEIDNAKYIVNLLIVNDDLINENVLLGTNSLCRDGSRLIIEDGRCFELGCCELATLKIELNSNSPVNLKPYRIPFAKRPIVSEIIKDLLDNNIIRPSESPYASPVVLVEKSNGEHRLCIDYRCLNKITVKMSYPMPIMEEHYAQLAGNKLFTTLDLRMEYHQIEINEDCKKYTAFVTTDGHYEYNRMPFGLVNAPAMFQAVMNEVIAKMKPGAVLAYLYDVIIPSRNVEEGLQRLQKFLGILRECGLTLRLAKCKFLQNEIEFLGHIINENDALSRSPDQPAASVEPAGFIMKVNPNLDDWVYTMQLQDPGLNEVIAILSGATKSPRESELRKEYKLQNKRLDRKEGECIKFVVPKAVRWRIVELYHDQMGHFAIDKTLDRICQTFWFPQIRKYVKKYTAACIECCYRKSHSGPFIRSKKGNSYVLAISDAFTKYLIVKPVRDKTTSHVITTLNEITSYFGLPSQVIIDRVERANQTILNYLRTSVENAKEWDLNLRNVQWTINSQKNSTSGFSPNELIFDFNLRDIIQNRSLAAVHEGT
ncbi:uncharacterized protein K02A2.6-like, partial [Rhagoletis pomonella]|uniref:uncharacterized protein K02A2.6-like n=1 Tax=Rhagoletis pomonella TaxID=28610 RepID=UPI00177AD2B4